MNAQVGRFAMIALLLAAALLAALFAFGVFSPQGTPGVSAHECQSPTDEHMDNSDPAVGCGAASGHADGDHARPTFGGDNYNSEDNYYDFSIMENRDGSTTAITIGQVMATLTGESVTYEFAGGTDPADFTSFASGHLQYTGSGLNFEADGDLTPDGNRKYLTATISVTAIKAGDTGADIADRTATTTIRVYVENEDADPPPAPMGVPTMMRDAVDAADATASTAAVFPKAALTVAQAKKAMDVTWERPEGLIEGTTAADNSSFTVEYRKVGEGDDDWMSMPVPVDISVDTDGGSDIVNIAPNMVTLTGLDEKADYEIRVKVADSTTDDNNNEWSAIGTGETASIPDKAEITVSSEGQGSGELMVSWINDGGGDSQAKYKVEYGERRSFDPIQDHTLLSFETAGSSAIIQDLDNGTLYHVRVRAMNRVGMADYSDVVSGTPYGKPSAPRNVQVLGVNHDTLLATWDAPSDMGGYDSVSYKVTHEKIGDASTAMTIEDVGATSIVISDLEPDTPYLVRVKAVNPRGDSRDAGIHFGRTAEAMHPGVVQNLSVTPVSHNALSVSWNAPASDGGAAIAGYHVQYRESDATNWTTVTRTGTDASQSISGLTAGTSYEVRVAATNSAGTGRYAQASARTMDAPPPTLPGPVENLSVSPVSQSELSVSWNAPASDGGAAITGYRVQYRESGATNWTTVSRAGTDLGESISGLTAGTSYEVRVAAMNSAGTGSYAQATAQTMAAPMPPADPCLEQLAGDMRVSGQWASGCDSMDRAGSHARFYTFTLTRESEVTVTLESDDADAYLYLRAGEAKAGTAVNDHAEDDDAGVGTNSQIEESLAAGTYTVEATTYHPGETGSFTLTLSGVGTTTPPPADPCLEKLTGDMRVSGQWASGCDSMDRAGSHARFYTFTLPQESEVTVILESDDADTFLYLREGAKAKFGSALHENDDHEGSLSRSQIRETLAAGSYTIEATTYGTGETGSFTLTLSGLGAAAPEPPPAEDCGETLSADGTVSGTWDASCDSETRDGRRAFYYSFTLTEEKEVTITLESADADTFLYLREGANAKSGAALHENDDHEGSLSRSQIRETLAAGSYTIEATTYEAGETGSFTLTVTGL